MRRRSGALIFAFLCIAALSWAEPLRLWVFGLERGTYHLWKNHTYSGQRYSTDTFFTWLLDADSLDVLTMVLYSDSTITDIRGPALGVPRIFPSPTNGIVTIDSFKAGEVEFYDVAGRRVTLVRVRRGSMTVGLALPSGVYFWRMGAAEGKIVVVR